MKYVKLEDLVHNECYILDKTQYAEVRSQAIVRYQIIENRKYIQFIKNINNYSIATKNKDIIIMCPRFVLPYLRLLSSIEKVKYL